MESFRPFGTLVTDTTIGFSSVLENVFKLTRIINALLIHTN